MDHPVWGTQIEQVAQQRLAQMVVQEAGLDSPQGVLTNLDSYNSYSNWLEKYFFFIFKIKL